MSFRFIYTWPPPPEQVNLFSTQHVRLLRVEMSILVYLIIQC
jgi:hypothetical protein